MKRWAILLASALIAGCANLPGAPGPEPLLADRLFAAPTERIRSDDIFAVSPEMKRYVATDIADAVRIHGPAQGLFAALNSGNALQLEYESTMTRNAAQSFAARAGNCLSLVIMTAAFAKELGLAVTYNKVYVEDAPSRVDDIYLSVGHVNLTLGAPHSVVAARALGRSDDLTIDFMPPRDLRGLRSRPIAESTIVAMYMNNRAVEAMAAGQLDDAYWWAREAIQQDPDFGSAYNTLGAVYHRHRDFAQAERVLRHALARDPTGTQVLSNLAGVLDAVGRTAEANEFRRTLAKLEPDPPFGYYRRGLVAMRTGDYRLAKELFAKEVERAPDFHEFHFWLAAASIELGELDLARKEMTLAMESSPTRGDRDLYSAKLKRINARITQ
jgi:Tfp pilus assembly protein PilF